MTTGLCRTCDFKQFANARATTTSKSPFIPKFDFESRQAGHLDHLVHGVASQLQYKRYKLKNKEVQKHRCWLTNALFHSCHDTCSKKQHIILKELQEYKEVLAATKSVPKTGLLL